MDATRLIEFAAEKCVGEEKASSHRNNKVYCLISIYTGFNTASSKVKAESVFASNLRSNLITRLM